MPAHITLPASFIFEATSFVTDQPDWGGFPRVSINNCMGAVRLAEGIRVTSSGWEQLWPWAWVEEAPNLTA